MSAMTSSGLSRGLALLAMLAGPYLTACSIDPYCLACAEGDGGAGDDAATYDGGGTVYDGGPEYDAEPPFDGCSPEPEQCDEIDHDCDGDPMNGFNLQIDPANCGSCGDACSLPGAAGTCSGGECSYECLPNRHDINGDIDDAVSNGCEYPCEMDPGGVEIACNFRDDDCDTITDEDFTSDVTNCGECFNVCVAANATAICDDKGTGDTADDECAYETPCDDHYSDNNAAILGCEYVCPVYPRLAQELCNGVDDDCDGEIDELPITGLGGDCYPDSLSGCVVGTGCEGVCDFGAVECSFGVEVCNDWSGPEPVELCDAVDHDCDGAPRNGFSTADDPNHCGDSCTVCALPHAVNGCSGGECYVIDCAPGWENPDGDDTDGCDYACTKTGPELCDGKDNDCDELTDEAGTFPDGIEPPSGLVCNSQGECDGPSPVCSDCAGTTTWRCDYRGGMGVVETDSCGALVLQETLCDGLDNDCDLEIDDSFPRVSNGPADPASECDDGGTGICRGTGEYLCDPVDDSAIICDITDPGQSAAAVEYCNNLDDNCNGLIDELVDPAAPGIVIMTDATVAVTGGTLSDGTTVVGNFVIDMYEASRPDATLLSSGSAAHIACSNADAMPWRTVTRPEAAAACLAAGKRLCSEDEWQRACEGAAYDSYPYGVDYDEYACNGYGYDEDCTSPNTNFSLYPTGNDYGCPPAADTCLSQAGVYDLSGNVQEWTASLISSSPDTYRVRGGTYQTQPGGLTCQHAFIAFDDTIEFPSLGFRCCQDAP